MSRAHEHRVRRDERWEGAANVIDEAEVALAKMTTRTDEHVDMWVKVADVESMLDRLANEYVPDHQFHR